MAIHRQRVQSGWVYQMRTRSKRWFCFSKTRKHFNVSEVAIMCKEAPTTLFNLADCTSLWLCTWLLRGGRNMIKKTWGRWMEDDRRRKKKEKLKEPTCLLLGDIGESMLVELLRLPEICQAVTSLQLLHQTAASLSRFYTTSDNVQGESNNWIATICLDS